LQNFANPRADHMALMQQLGFDLNAWLHRLVTRSSTPCLRVPDLAIALRSLERYVSVAGGDAIRLRGIPRRRRHRRQRKQLLQLLVALCHACDRGPPTSSPSVVASEVALLLATALRERQVALESLERLRTHQADHTAPQTSGARTDLASSVYYTALRQCVFQWLCSGCCIRRLRCSLASCGCDFQARRQRITRYRACAVRVRCGRVLRNCAAKIKLAF
jgi:hypothetical protein